VLEVLLFSNALAIVCLKCAQQHVLGESIKKFYRKLGSNFRTEKVSSRTSQLFGFKYNVLSLKTSRMLLRNIS
jgi:hypothetical protein